MADAVDGNLIASSGRLLPFPEGAERAVFADDCVTCRASFSRSVMRNLDLDPVLRCDLQEFLNLGF